MHLKKISCQRKNCLARCRRCQISCFATMSDPSSTFTFAAMDTTSSALARILHILSTRLDVQSKLRQEIVDARSHHGNLEYDELVALPYLDAVCRESLRLSVLDFLFSCQCFVDKSILQLSAQFVCDEDVR